MSLFSRLFRDRHGIAAVEFALLSSFILLPLFIGLIEILTLYRSEAKLTALTTDVALMVSYNVSTDTGITSLSVPTATGAASLQDICQGAVQAVFPYPSNGMTLAISSVTVESNSAGLPQSDTAVYTTTPKYDVWEADFTVSNGTCTAAGLGSTTSGSTTTMTGSPIIGYSNAVSLATTSPPSTSGTQGLTGLVAVPCDNAIIVQTKMTYPGLVGVLLKSRPVLTQSSYARWAAAWNEAELQCSGTHCGTQYAVVPPTCTTTNTSAIN